ncbi:hypothetical protein Pint_34122 [Pistacia integerrima]|uniref:Uncharacterized protein n=1 Tax=Pistacia integerrima TaxID=434235 RepID=A0ACC0X6C7_9ROSI|nr:hypothetical protein Pint_34122 [Pistacia integerrima]
MQLLRDNLTLWTFDIPEDGGNSFFSPREIIFQHFYLLIDTSGLLTLKISLFTINSSLSPISPYFNSQILLNFSNSKFII